MFPTTSQSRARSQPSYLTDVGLDYDDTVGDPQPAMQQACAISLATASPAGRRQLDAVAATWMTELDSLWQQFPAAVRLNYQWGFSGHEAAMGPMTEFGNSFVAPERLADRHDIIRWIPHARRLALRTALKTHGVKLDAGEIERVAARIPAVRFDPTIDLDVFMPGAPALLTRLRGHPHVRTMFGTNGDYEVQVFGKIEDAKRRAPGVLDGIPIYCSGYHNVDAAKPDESMLVDMAHHGAGAKYFVFVGNRIDTDILAALNARTYLTDRVVVPVLYDPDGRVLSALPFKERSQKIAFLADNDVVLATSHDDTFRVVDMVTKGQFREALSDFSPIRLDLHLKEVPAAPLMKEGLLTLTSR